MSANSDGAFVKNFLLVIGGLGLIGVVIIVIASIYGSGVETHTKGVDARVAQRLAPVATVVTDASQLKTASSSAGSGKKLTGKQLVSQVCSSCHGAGVLGAPKIGDHANWSARFKQAGGVDGLLAVAEKGKGNMPARGGNPALTNDELKSAIEYMLHQSDVKF